MQTTFCHLHTNMPPHEYIISHEFWNVCLKFIFKFCGYARSLNRLANSYQQSSPLVDSQIYYLIEWSNGRLIVKKIKFLLRLRHSPFNMMFLLTEIMCRMLNILSIDHHINNNNSKLKYWNKIFYCCFKRRRAQKYICTVVSEREYNFNASRMLNANKRQNL